MVLGKDKPSREYEDQRERLCRGTMFMTGTVKRKIKKKWKYTIHGLAWGQRY